MPGQESLAHSRLRDRVEHRCRGLCGSFPAAGKPEVPVEFKGERRGCRASPGARQRCGSGVNPPRHAACGSHRHAEHCQGHLPAVTPLITAIMDPGIDTTAWFPTGSPSGLACPRCAVLTPALRAREGSALAPDLLRCLALTSGPLLGHHCCPQSCSPLLPGAIAPQSGREFPSEIQPRAVSNPCLPHPWKRCLHA